MASNKRLKGVKYTNISSHRERRPVRDATIWTAIWFVCWLIPAVALLNQGSLFGALFFGACGLLGAWPFRWGAGMQYPGDWWSGFLIKQRGDVIHGPNSPGGHNTIRKDLFISKFWDIATIYVKSKRTDTITFSVTGWLHANDDLLNRQFHEQRVAAVVKTVIAQTDTDIDYTMLNGSRPFDPTAWAKDTEEHFLSEAVLNPQTAVLERVRDNLNNAFLLTALKGADPIMCFTISVKRPREWRRIADNPGNFTKAQLNRSPLKRVLDAMESGLERSGYRDVRIDGLEQVNERVFKSHNVSYVGQMLEGEHPGYSSKLDPWPKQGIRIDGDYLVTDDSYHRTFVVSVFGISRFLPGGLQPLLSGHMPWVTVSYCSYTVSKMIEYWLIAKSRDLRAAWISEHYSKGMVVDQKERDKRQVTIDRVDNLYISGSKPIRYNVYIVVSGTSKDNVEASYAALQAKLRELRIKVIPVEGRARMLRIFLSATLGLRT